MASDDPEAWPWAPSPADFFVTFEWPAAILTREFVGVLAHDLSPWAGAHYRDPEIKAGESPYATRVRVLSRLRWILAVERILEDKDEDFPECRSTDRARDALLDALREHLEAVGRAFERDGGPRPGKLTLGGFVCDLEPSFEAGILAIDERLARHLEAIGKSGVAIAAKLRDRATERKATSDRLLEEWVPDGETGVPKALRHLALVLWRDVVGPRLERERKDPPALVMSIHKAASRLFSRVTREEERNGQRVIPMPGDTVVRVATMDAGALNATMVDRGIKLFGTVAAHRVLRWQVFTGHTQALEGSPDPRVITVEGGIEGLTHDILGMKSKKDSTKVRDIIEAEHAIELTIQGGSLGRLLNRTLYPAHGQRRARLELVLGTLLLPNYVHHLRKLVPTLASAESRLVPVLALPPFVGGQERSYGPQATFSMLLVAVLRERARELVAHGGVRLTDEELAALAEKAGLAASTVPKVLDRWLLDGDDGPAFLARVGRDRYTLGAAHMKERAFLEKGGRREIQGAERGKLAVRNKLAKLNRLEKRRRK